MNKIKKFVENHKEEIIVGAVRGLVYGTLGVASYTYACNKRGFYMTKPSHYDENFFYVTTPGGRTLKSAKVPNP